MPITPIITPAAHPRFAASRQRFAGSRFASAPWRRYAVLAPGLLACALLSGCGMGGYPSLARRAGEVSYTAAPPPPAAIDPAMPVPPALATQLQAALAQARKAQADFDTALPGAEARLTAAADSERGSPPWAQASIALGTLEGYRAQLSIPQAQIEDLYTADRLAYPGEDATPRPTMLAIAQVRDDIAAIATAQDATLARLRARLR